MPNNGIALGVAWAIWYNSTMGQSKFEDEAIVTSHYINIAKTLAAGPSNPDYFSYLQMAKTHLLLIVADAQSQKFSTKSIEAREILGLLRQIK